MKMNEKNKIDKLKLSFLRMTEIRNSLSLPVLLHNNDTCNSSSKKILLFFLPTFRLVSIQKKKRKYFLTNLK